MPLLTDPGLLIRDFVLPTVALSDTLATEDTFVLEPFLYCDELVLRTNAYSTATLSREIGDAVLRPGTSAFANVQAVDLIGQFVLVTKDNSELAPDLPDSPRGWIGYIIGQVQDRSAIEGAQDPDDNKLTGRRQIFQAVGLEYFLDRVQVGSAVVYDNNATPPEDEVRIERALIFNGDASSNYDANTTRRGNRHPDTQLTEADAAPAGGEEVYAFADGSATPVLWSARQMVDHLLRYQQPLDKNGVRAPGRYQLEPGSRAILANLYPTVATERKTVFELLNEIINPSRAICWWPHVRWDGVEYVIDITVESRATAALTLAAGGTLPANADQQTVSFDGGWDIAAGQPLPGQRDVANVVLRDDRSLHYDQVVVRGARQTATATFGFGDSTLEKDWLAATETAYEAASDPAAGTEKVNDRFRRAEKFYRVYAAFRIPAAWDGKTGDGVGGETKDYAIADLSPSGAVISAKPLSLNQLRVLKTTRLRRGYDYTASASSPTSTDPPNTEPDFMPPFAAFQVDDGTPKKYQFADKLSGTESKDSGDTTSLKSSYRLYSQHSTPGIRLRANAGLPHVFARGEWTAPAPLEVSPELAYQLLLATLTVEGDAWCESKSPAVPAPLPATKAVEILTLYVGDHYRLDFLAPNTVVDLADGALSKTVGGVLRDDRTQLSNIADLAYDWYRVDRQPVTITFKNQRDVFRLGMMLTEIGEGSTAIPVNTVVNSIRFDFKRGQMSITTDGDEVDLVGLVA